MGLFDFLKRKQKEAPAASADQSRDSAESEPEKKESEESKALTKKEQACFNKVMDEFFRENPGMRQQFANMGEMERRGQFMIQFLSYRTKCEAAGKKVPPEYESARKKLFPIGD